MSSDRCPPGYKPGYRYDSLDSGACVKELTMNPLTRALAYIIILVGLGFVLFQVLGVGS